MCGACLFWAQIGSSGTGKRQNVLQTSAGTHPSEVRPRIDDAKADISQPYVRLSRASHCPKGQHTRAHVKSGQSASIFRHTFVTTGQRTYACLSRAIPGMATCHRNRNLWRRGVQSVRE